MSVARHAPGVMAPHATSQPAPQPGRPSAEPFLKWAGGKARLLPQLAPLLPRRMGRYFEPFVGGGALFFRTAPAEAVLGDINPDLVNVYRCVRDDLPGVIRELRRHRFEKNHYYAVRAQDPATLSPAQRAARMIYLNRSCFNGLYRVNRRGQFNVPFGSYSNPDICPVDRLTAASAALQGVDVAHGHYAELVARARPGDFVYFDPPYVPISRTANFTGYTKEDFGPDDQAALADTFRALVDRGVQCMLSNSDVPFVRELYRGFRVETVLAPRAISRSAEGRAPVTEVVVLGY